MSSPRILVFAGSLRTGSFNQKLANLAAKLFREVGAEVTELNLGDYPLPLYDGNLQASKGIPEEALKMHAQLRTHDGVFIATPECIPPLLSNQLAWVSRITDHGGIAAAFGSPIFAIASASPGSLGGYRGLMALRNSLELGLGARVLSQMESIASASQAFAEDGSLSDKRSEKILGQVMARLVGEAGNQGRSGNR
ncbi:MAG: NAD(P)H-dependent oxidoreductase [Acidobacteriaceae bacterium]